MRVLHLTLKKKWFDLIASGEKKEEYREIKDFWIKRLALCSGKTPVPFGYFCKKAICVSCIERGDGFKPKDFTHVQFARGGHFHESLPQMMLHIVGIKVDEGKPEWGAEPGKKYFVIELGEIVKG